MIMYHTPMKGFAEPWQVTLFLVLFKELAQSRFYFADRERSLDCIAQLGITVEQAKVEILGLTLDDYYRGQIADTSPEGGEYWEFG